MKVVRKRTLKLKHARIATAPAVSVLSDQAVLCSLSAQEGLAGWPWAVPGTLPALPPAQVHSCHAALLPPGHRGGSSHWDSHHLGTLLVSLESLQPLWQVPGSHAVPWAAPSRAGDVEMLTCVVGCWKSRSASSVCLEKAPRAGSDKVAIRVFSLPAHGCLALSPSEIPSLSRIHGPAVSWGSVLPARSWAAMLPTQLQSHHPHLRLSGVCCCRGRSGKSRFLLSTV